MTQWLVPIIILFIILVTIQYSINKVIVLLKEIKEILKQDRDKNNLRG